MLWIFIIKTEEYYNDSIIKHSIARLKISIQKLPSVIKLTYFVLFCFFSYQYHLWQHKTDRH